MRAITFLGICLAAVCTAGWAGGTQEPAAEDAAGIDAVVVYLEGSVTIDGSPAEIGSKAAPGALVVTGEDSYCEIVFLQRNIFRIQEGTEAVIRIEPGTGNIDIRRGAVGALFSKLEELVTGESFKVRSSIASAGVRGTAFFVKVLADGSTYICACNGSLETGPANQESFGLASGHHKAVMFRKDTDTGRVVYEDAPLLFHNDSGMEEIASRIGETISWDY